MENNNIIQQTIHAKVFGEDTKLKASQDYWDGFDKGLDYGIRHGTKRLLDGSVFAFIKEKYFGRPTKAEVDECGV